MKRKLLTVLRIIVSVFLLLHIAFWVGMLTQIDWVSYSAMVRPPTFIMLIFSACGLYLIFPYGQKKRKRFCIWTMVAALFAFGVGVTLDIVDRFRLVERVEEAHNLRYEYVSDPLTAGQKGMLVALLRAEPIRVNLGTSLANMFVGYNTCLCGDGDGIEIEWGGILFSSKHGDELYIRGFVSFHSTRHIVWDIDSEF